ncbi:hypothetical protein BU23DRAFT_59689 [Bimuria novae-zelandiae CBS 107.79]|uniref:Uncharacterized protein n=1 Tax=Bimuria novae-zelandiae CBS 107.79 TaxID=1447943 RepID=A0A6A5VH53_9PLEO|nr:hypothetical protein BU23DRAFT_59689 [Bimuria novae-zelandiae CBS 107.79]
MQALLSLRSPYLSACLSGLRTASVAHGGSIDAIGRGMIGVSDTAGPGGCGADPLMRLLARGTRLRWTKCQRRASARNTTRCRGKEARRLRVSKPERWLYNHD